MVRLLIYCFLLLTYEKKKRTIRTYILEMRKFGSEDKRVKEMKTALVVEGGAMRGIFSAGVLDAFLEVDYNPFDICVGVSAGATNLAAYLGKMQRRNYTVYTKYSLDKRFINPVAFLKGGHLMDLDWLWEITIDKLRLDLDVIENSPSEFVIGMTEIKSGQIKYVVPTKDNLETVLKASSAVPIFYRNPVTIDSVDYWDGGVTDPIPVREAVRRGAKKIVVIRSRKKHFKMADKNKLIAQLGFRKYPKMGEAVLNRPSVYNETINYLRESKDDVEIIEVCPPDGFQTGRLTKDKNTLDMDYALGFRTGEALAKDLKKHF